MSLAIVLVSWIIWGVIAIVEHFIYPGEVIGDPEEILWEMAGKSQKECREILKKHSRKKKFKLW